MSRRGYSAAGAPSALQGIGSAEEGAILVGASSGRYTPLSVGLDSDFMRVDPATHRPAWHLHYDWIPEDNGYFAGNCAPKYTDSAAQTLFQLTGAAGVIVGSRIKIPKSRVVTNIHAQVFTAGVAPTGCYGAAFQNGVLIGQTADQAAVWNATGPKVMALTGGPFAIVKGYLDVGFWYGGGTPPAFTRPGLTTGATMSANTILQDSWAWLGNTGLTTTAPGTLTKSTAIGTQIIVWLS